jgi:predicted phage-related endonuclease
MGNTLALHRRSFIGGSDARIVMGDDEAALIRLWREKRGEWTCPAIWWSSWGSPPRT